jgi:hypothetical protein
MRVQEKAKTKTHHNSSTTRGSAAAAEQQQQSSGAFSQTPNQPLNLVTQSRKV